MSDHSYAEILIYAGGWFSLGFVVFHLMFWRLFHWREDLASLRRINRAVMQILNLCLTFIFMVMAYVSFFHAPGLLQTGLGQTLLIAFSLFWFLRMIEQIVFFGVRRKMSVALTLVFLLGSLIYLLPII